MALEFNKKFNLFNKSYHFSPILFPFYFCVCCGLLFPYLRFCSRHCWWCCSLPLHAYIRNFFHVSLSYMFFMVVLFPPCFNSQCCLWCYFYLFFVSIHDVHINVVISSFMFMYVTLLVDVLPSSISMFAMLFMAIFSSMFLFAMMLVIVFSSFILMDIMLVLLQLHSSTIIIIICASTHGIVFFSSMLLVLAPNFVVQKRLLVIFTLLLVLFLLLPTSTFHFEVNVFFLFLLYVFWFYVSLIYIFLLCMCICICIFFVCSSFAFKNYVFWGSFVCLF